MPDIRVSRRTRTSDPDAPRRRPAQGRRGRRHRGRRHPGARARDRARHGRPRPGARAGRAGRPRRPPGGSAAWARDRRSCARSAAMPPDARWSRPRPRDGVTVKAVRVAGARTGRIGVLVEPDGQRSFVQDRGAALRLRPEDLKADWFAGADAVHLPAYSLLDEPLGRAGMAAIRLAREAGALVTVDLASTAPLLALGRRAGIAVIAGRGAGPGVRDPRRGEGARWAASTRRRCSSSRRSPWSSGGARARRS